MASSETEIEQLAVSRISTWLWQKCNPELSRTTENLDLIQALARELWSLVRHYPKQATEQPDESPLLALARELADKSPDSILGKKAAAAIKATPTRESVKPGDLLPGDEDFPEGLLAVPVKQMQDIYARFGRLAKLGQSPVEDWIFMPAELRKLKQEVFGEADMGAVFAGNWVRRA